LYYYTCRHTYEDTLINEIKQYAQSLNGNILAMSPFPGLVRVEDEFNILPTLYDPVYALQSMPDAVVVTGDSIKKLANEIHDVLLSNDEDDDLRSRLRSASRGSLAIHPMVPGMCKGQIKPIMQNRCERIGEELVKLLRKTYPAARKYNENDNNENDTDEVDGSNNKWLLQFMLQSNTIAVASLTQCECKGPGLSYWPNWSYPLGLAHVDIEEKMPSSAYRKLLEALGCMNIQPSQSSYVVDLGASPGGWTSVMRRLGSYVTAVDRSRLDKPLMIDNMVNFVKGDAFTFTLTDYYDTTSQYDEIWMISDIISYPKRCTELLNSWCSEQGVQFMVVTMKFQGDQPDLSELQRAVKIVQSHGYLCRVKHFFNNKNEVTFMIAKPGNDHGYPVHYPIGKPIYKRSLPK